MKDKDLRRWLGWDKYCSLKRIDKIERQIEVLLKELGYEYQDSCREYLPKLNKIK